MSDSNSSASAGSILIVDDHPITINAAESILSTAGFQVHFLMESKGVVEWVEENIPDLVLLDIIMPALNGLEVCRRLKANPVTAKIPVIFLTARGAPESREEGLKAGGIDYITKPVQTRDLIARVQAHMNRR